MSPEMVPGGEFCCWRSSGLLSSFSFTASSSRCFSEGSSVEKYHNPHTVAPARTPPPCTCAQVQMQIQVRLNKGANIFSSHPHTHTHTQFVWLLLLTHSIRQQQSQSKHTRFGRRTGRGLRQASCRPLIASAAVRGPVLGGPPPQVCSPSTSLLPNVPCPVLSAQHKKAKEQKSKQAGKQASKQAGKQASKHQPTHIIISLSLHLSLT